MNYDEMKYYALQCHEKNPKKLWKNLNKILGRKEKDNINAVFDNNGNLLTDDLEIAESFNKNFISSIDSILNEKDVCEEKLEEEPCNMEINDIIVNENDIENIINSLKNASQGIDNINTKVVKTLSKEISPILLHLIKMIFVYETYPACMKTAVVIPINKSGNKTSLSDYRPVSILSIFNKIIEKIIHKEIYHFVYNEASLIYERQYGFRKRCRTETAVMELVNEIRTEMDNKRKVSAVGMDIRKAFDLVNTQRLLHALNLSGIRGKMLNVIASYLSDRKQIVRINNASSNTIDISHGVVQGGVLGSLLFIIFFNYIIKLSLNGRLFLYADDAILINSHESSENIETKILNDMNVIKKFLDIQLLFLNNEKTNFIVFHNPQMKCLKPNEIKIGNSRN